MGFSVQKGLLNTIIFIYYSKYYDWIIYAVSDIPI